MKPTWKQTLFLLTAAIFIFSSLPVSGQVDTTDKSQNKTQSLIGKVINTFKKDTTEVDKANELQRNDKKFLPYEGLIIRDIVIDRLPFGIPIKDTTKKLASKVVNLANDVHHLTRVNVIRRNLFFDRNDTIQPYLMADNVRFLRQLPYLQDAELIAVPIAPGSDSADIIVLTKDIFSLGGAIGSLGFNRTDIEAREDNLAGSGNAAVIYGLYDKYRQNKVALGGEYVRRNIGGSFVDGRIGYQNNYNSVPGPRQENYYYLFLSKPLINRYMRWTYELNTSFHSTRNLYLPDSLYLSDFKYRYSNVELWAGYNVFAKKFSDKDEKHKLRKIIGARFINNQFTEIPPIYKQDYNWRFADLTAVLATVTFYRQDFYKTQYIYGFGRNEDIPEGLQLSFTTGYTLKEKLSRPFIGFNYERYRFNKKNNYLGYILRAEGYLGDNKMQDINLLAAVNYFDKLKTVGAKWKQRFFLNLDVAQQINSVLNEPLYLKSQFGLPEYGNNYTGGTLRATGKAESVFFSPWSVVAFRFAPFVFGNFSVFSPKKSPLQVYTSTGGGLRMRNESFVFGTIELKGFYFPQKNFYNEKFSFEISTNVIFKYNTEFVKKPDFIQIN